MLRPPPRLGPASARPIVPLLVLFGSLYFVQGIVEPTACLPAQPMQSQLRSWGLTVEQVGHFFGIIAIAWSIKPLFGLVSDMFPIGGQRRRPYLILSTVLTGVAFLALATFWGRAEGETGWLDATFRWLAGLSPDEAGIGRIGWLLVFTGIAIATTDVVIDALAVETGQPLKITGQIQSVQWGALSVAGLLAGSLGGYVAQQHLQRPMFAACGVLGLVSLAVVLLTVREPGSARRPLRSARRPPNAARRPTTCGGPGTNSFRAGGWRFSSRRPCFCSSGTSTRFRATCCRTT